MDVYAIFGHSDFSVYGTWALTVNQVCFFIIVHYSIMTNRWRELRFLTIITLFGLLLSGLMGAQTLGMEHVEGARNLVGDYEAVGERAEQQEIVFNLGLGDYRFVYMCAWICPLLLMAAYKVLDKPIKLVLWLTAGAMVVVVKTSGLGTVTAVVAISIMLYFAWRFFRNSLMFLRISGCGLVLMFFVYATAPSTFGFLSGPLKTIGESMGEGSVRERILLMAASFSGDKMNYAYDRAQLQLISWRGFCERPIFGWGWFYHVRGKGTTKKATAGGHSLVLDRLSYYGLVGTIPFFMMIFSFLKYYRLLAKWYFGQGWRSLPILFMGLFIFTSLANPTFGIPHMIYIILPGLGHLVDLSRWKQQRLKLT